MWHLQEIQWHTTTHPIRYQTYHLTRIQIQVHQILLRWIHLTRQTKNIIKDDQILAVNPQGRRRSRLIVILKIMIFFRTFWFLSRKIMWHLYLPSYWYRVCNSRRLGWFHQIGPCDETFAPKGYSVNISQIQSMILCPRSKQENPWM